MLTATTRSASLFSSIDMYDNEYGQTAVEEDKEDMAYDDEAIFEMDDFPSQSYQHHSPETSVRYFVPTHEEPHGLSQSMIVNEHDYLVSNILRMRPSNYYAIQDSDFNSESLQIVYSQSAPSYSYLSDYPDFSKCDSISDDHHSLDFSDLFIIHEKSNRSSYSPTKPPPPSDADTDTQQEQDTDPINITASETTENKLSINHPSFIPESIKELNAYLSLQYDTPLPSSEQTSSETESVDFLLVPRYASRVVDYRIPSGKYENSYAAWSALSTRHYETNNQFQYPPDEFYSEINRQWEILHCNTKHLERVTKNPFIFENILRHEFSIKVTGLKKKWVSHRNLIDHFHSCNVVFTRYFHFLCCAYIGYRHYEAMLRAVEKFDRTNINGCTIYCRPSDVGELAKDDDMYVKALSQSSYQLKRKTIRKSNNFIPECYGFRQTSKTYRPVDESLEMYDTSTTCSTAYNRAILSRYHPKAITTILPVKLVKVNYQHRHYLDKIIPLITPGPVCYIITKPWSNIDIRLSQDIQYWSFYPQNATIVNFLFNSTPEVHLIFSIAGSKMYHGHAIMKSEIMDLKSLGESYLTGTPFQGFNKKFILPVSNRSWRFVCKVEWINTSTSNTKCIGKYSNPWWHNKQINRLSECTIIEPTVGQQLVNAISNH